MARKPELQTLPNPGPQVHLPKPNYEPNPNPPKISEFKPTNWVQPNTTTWEEVVVVVNKSVLLMRSYTILVSMEDYIALQRKVKAKYSGVGGYIEFKIERRSLEGHKDK